MNPKKVIVGVFGVLLILFTLYSMPKLVENVASGEICVIQALWSGKLSVYTQPGTVMQNFGTVTVYKKSFQYWFTKDKDQGTNTDQSVKVRFNDGGHAQISGSCRIDLPLDEESIKILHIKYGSQEAIERSLVRTTIEKAVYMTGPLMSSKESSSTKRTDLLNYISDQTEFGVYKTKQIERKVQEDGSDSSKIVTVVEILKGEDTNPIRQEKSPFAQLHIGFTNLSINSLDYDDAVEKQIKSQQELAMQVQTAMARAKTAEQQVYTTQREGEAAAAKAKWEQEVLKAKAVTEAEQNLEVQQLATKTAASYKEQQILEGQGDAEKKRLSMQANGALEQKLAAYVTVQEAWAKAAEQSQWVPTYAIGGGSQNGGTNVSTMVDAISIKALRDLGLDMSNKTK